MQGMNVSFDGSTVVCVGEISCGKSVQDICLQSLAWNAKEEMSSLLNDGGSGSNNSNIHPYDNGGNDNCC